MEQQMNTPLRFKIQVIWTSNHPLSHYFFRIPST